MEEIEQQDLFNELFPDEEYQEDEQYDPFDEMYDDLVDLELKYGYGEDNYDID